MLNSILICTLYFLFVFSVLFVKTLRELTKKRDAEILFIDMFGHDVQQPSPGRDVNRTLRRPILTFVYSRRL